MKIPHFSINIYLLSAILLTGFCWYLLWSQSYYLSPILFTGLWAGAAFILYSISSTGYPGIKIHLFLSCVSVPLWWWFELANARLMNWQYITDFDYGTYPYIALASISFSTVIPALDSSHKFVGSFLPKGEEITEDNIHKSLYWEMVLGISAVTLVYLLPQSMFPLLWIGPLLIIDSIAGLFTNRSFLHCFTQRKHMIMLSLSLSGILCGFMWEFWNNWASPSWVYQIPIFEYFYVFEMPILGYLGYIPFAWTVFQYQSLMKLFVNKYIFKQPFIVSK